MTEQRRAHVRVPWEIEVRIMRLAGRERIGWLDVVALDLSAGGLQIAGPELLRPGDPLRIELTLPGGERIECAARVARIAPHPEYRLIQGVEIEGVTERDRDAIVRHVFKRQQELLRLRAETST